MPIYEYECPRCQAAFERLIRSESDERETACPQCGSRKVERRPSVFSARASTASAPLPRGGCGRCGDPNGPCGMA